MRIGTSNSAVVTGRASGLGLARIQAAGVEAAIFRLRPRSREKAAAETGARFCQAAVLSGNGPDAAFAKARANGQDRILITCAGGGNAMITIRRDRETGAMKLFRTAELWPHRQLFVDAHGGRPHFEFCEIR